MKRPVALWLRRPPSRNAQRQPIGILGSTLAVLAALLLVAALIWTLFTRLLRDAWPWQYNGLEVSTPGWQLVQLVLTLMGGLGAAILVVVAYRRQRDLELVRFDERFSSAAEQLGAETAAERIAGVYAMASLADSWVVNRQQCVDVLCNYLRLPFDPFLESSLSEVVSEHTWPVARNHLGALSAVGKEARKYKILPHDGDVRKAIMRVIAMRLRDSSESQFVAPAVRASWQGCYFDFSDAVFTDVNLMGLRLTNEQTVISFRGCRFLGGEVDLSDTEIHKGYLGFQSAEFHNTRVLAQYVDIRDHWLSFAKVRAFNSDFLLLDINIDGGDVVFSNAEFSGGLLSLDGAKLNEGGLGFRDAIFKDDAMISLEYKKVGADFSFSP